jgi:hypothetical protein
MLKKAHRLMTGPNNFSGHADSPNLAKKHLIGAFLFCIQKNYYTYTISKWG